MRAAEASFAFALCLVLPVLMRGYHVNPVERTGQVSGLAALELRFGVLALLLVGLVLAGHRFRGGRYFDHAKRLACAGTAGIASGFVAGGTVVALLGTPWPIFGLSGDTGRLVAWSASIVHGHGNPNPSYPPLTLHLIAGWAQAFHGGNTAWAFRDLEILGAAVTGPLAYLAWRLVLRPLWALGCGVLPAFSIIDPYKPYSAIVMIVLLPVFIRFVSEARRVGDAQWRPLIVTGAVFGVGFATLFLLYPGSSLWCAPGLIAALVFAFPWSRQAAIRLGAFLAVTAGVFGTLAGWYVLILLGPIDADRAYGFDAYTNPSFFSMWRTDMPGQVGQWPPPGELGGVGLFTILTFAAMGVALWLGMRRSAVLTVTCIFVGTWLWRMWFASQMWVTGDVQLWPRTDNQLLYCSFVGSALAFFLVAQRVPTLVRTQIARLAPADTAAAEDGEPRVNPVRKAVPAGLPVTVGGLFAVLMLLGTSASTVSDAWMPSKTNSYKELAYVSQTMRKPDGSCPRYAPDHECSTQGDQAWISNFYVLQPGR
jgi:galactan 5-O-arabinofuranosyltransferase